jgi:hypothetical protein
VRACPFKFATPQRYQAEMRRSRIGFPTFLAQVTFFAQILAEIS